MDSEGLTEKIPETKVEGRESGHTRLGARVFPKTRLRNPEKEWGLSQQESQHSHMPHRVTIPMGATIHWKGHIPPAPGAYNRNLRSQRWAHASRGPFHQESLTPKEESQGPHPQDCNTIMESNTPKEERQESNTPREVLG